MLPSSGLIKEWEYEGDRPMNVKLPIDDSPYRTVQVSEDTAPILFRTIEFNQKQIQLKAQKEREKQKSKTNTEKTVISKNSIKNLSTNDLKKQLKALGLSTDGTREQILARFEKFVKK
ncbi:hypothetical protein TVAG_159360 [Trichomonas vaginalis G3]|uniref:SAP domain-containing protein n=1 Tax=Trichomonas vaginalis (strain ATCC PRA-98 / G3) TaxID=412133 RepID=A2F591_TRIV3|nr:SAP domain family [Trichomonas vaginalis G3]EAX99916.1 hypothetical protein TVAG_159360 [Trichomonas vaginalis G3]KAI5547803.1 SAP domain family [Trichomonas vaginalis G3]|eukprot:XP_001312846.1 hypothetical protein [Trichomonas vaginalis G3]